MKQIYKDRDPKLKIQEKIQKRQIHKTLYLSKKTQISTSKNRDQKNMAHEKQYLKTQDPKMRSEYRNQKHKIKTKRPNQQKK